MTIGMIELRPLALKLRDAFGIRHFVETGTYKAGTTTWAANEFEHVTTIEAFEQYHREASAKHAGLTNVTWVYGNSGEYLRQYLPDEPAIIWLDAHWCGNFEMSLGTPGECPIRQELEALNRSPHNHFVMIDDARLFLAPPKRPHDPAQWPSFKEVAALLKARHPRRIFVWKDAIIAVPPEAAQIVREITEQKDGPKVVVLTSNDYLRCMGPFTHLFNKYWSSSQRVTVVRYDKRPRGLPVNFTNIAIGKQADYTWSSGLINHLNYTMDDMFILLLEDYFIDRPVNIQRIASLWQYMESHPEVVKIDLSGDRLRFAHEDYPEAYDLGLVRSMDDASFQTSLQAAIWRKDFLLRFLEPSEGPWQYEKKGTGRVIAARERGEFDGVILGAKAPPLHYINAVGGEGNFPGQYDFKKFTPELKSELNGARLL